MLHDQAGDALSVVSTHLHQLGMAMVCGSHGVERVCQNSLFLLVAFVVVGLVVRGL
jgi:hypothetical protein